jgi:hypothetical protein
MSRAASISRVDERGVEGVARDQHGLGANHLHVAIRNIEGEVDGARRQRQRRNE